MALPCAPCALCGAPSASLPSAPPPPARASRCAPPRAPACAPRPRRLRLQRHGGGASPPPLPLPLPPLRARAVIDIDDDEEYNPVVDFPLASVSVVRAFAPATPRRARPCFSLSVTRSRVLSVCRMCVFCACSPPPQGRRVGSGSFGEVFLGEVEGEDGEAVDVVLKKRKLSLNAQRVRARSFPLVRAAPPSAR
jgi:hypothetical protein